MLHFIVCMFLTFHPFLTGKSFERKLNSHFFFNLDQCQLQPNHETHPLWVQGIGIVPNCHTLAGFAIGALCLVTIANLHLRTLHKTNICSSRMIFYFLATQAQKNHLIQLGNHGNLSKHDISKKNR